MYVQVFAHGNRALRLIIKAPQSSRGEGEGLRGGGGGGGGGTVKATPPPPLLCSIHSLPHPPPTKPSLCHIVGGRRRKYPTNSQSHDDDGRSPSGVSPAK